jgi:hypothetical protein
MFWWNTNRMKITHCRRLWSYMHYWCDRYITVFEVNRMIEKFACGEKTVDEQHILVPTKSCQANTDCQQFTFSPRNSSIVWKPRQWEDGGPEMGRSAIHYYWYFVTTFMQGIYNYIPETNHVSRVHSIVAVVYLQSVHTFTVGLMASTIAGLKIVTCSLSHNTASEVRTDGMQISTGQQRPRQRKSGWIFR